jgi:hypothetical protein
MLASKEETFMPFDRSRLPLSEDPDHHPQNKTKNEPFNQERHLKIPLFKPGFGIVKFYTRL